MNNTLRLILTLLLIVLVIPTRAWAADDVVKSIEWEKDAPVHMYVAENTFQAKVLAVIEGSSTKKEVTNDAVWLSSNVSVAKVDKGLITPVSKGTTKITAKYKGFSLTLDVTADYLFKELQLSEAGPIQADLGDSNVEFKAFAVENNLDSNQVTDSADWNSSNAAVATVTKGKLTLLATGQTTISAKYKGLSDSVQVNVGSPYTLLAIEPSASQELMVGQTIGPLTAMATLKSGTKEDITQKAEWKSSASGVLKVEKGILTAVAPGMAKLSVQHLGAYTEMNVIVRLPFQALTLTPGDDLSLFLSDKPVQIQASVMNDIVTKKDVTSTAEWNSSNPFAVTVTNGLITPKSAGTATITVSYLGLTRRLQVTVFQTMAGMKLDVDNIKLFKGEVQTLPKLTGMMLDDQVLNVSALASWESSDSSVLMIDKGKITAKKPGSVKLKAAIRDLKAEVDVTVQEKVLMLQPNKRSLSVVEGKSEALPVVKAIMEDGTEVNITQMITWTASSPVVLIKDNTIRALAGGRVSLSGTYLNKSITIPITIEEEITELKVEPAQLELNPGLGKSLKVTAYYSDERTANLSSKMSWTSSDPAVVVVKGYNLSAVAVGTAKLTASYQGKSVEVTVTVVPRLTRIELSEKSLKVNSGDSTKVELTAIYENGKAVDITEEADWTSSNNSIAVVKDGTIDGLKKGYVTIKAVYNKKTVFIRVQVK